MGFGSGGRLRTSVKKRKHIVNFLRVDVSFAPPVFEDLNNEKEPISRRGKNGIDPRYLLGADKIWKSLFSFWHNRLDDPVKISRDKLDVKPVRVDCPRFF